MAILTMARHRFYKNDGSLNSGGKVWTYVAGTTTPAATYTSSDASVANTNPIILDSKGECDLWVTGQIKVNVLESDNSQVTGWPVDNVGSGVANNDATMRWAGTAAGTANALTITPSPAIAAYVVGQSFIFKAGASPNSAATTIAISGLTPIEAQINGSALAGGEILAGKWYSIVLDSLTTCQVEPVASAALAGSTTQVFNVEGATADDHAVSRVFGDARYAALAGSASQVFSVAAATAAAHAVRLDQLGESGVSNRTAGNLTTSSTALIDVTDASITITTKARRIAFAFSCNTSNNTANASNFFNINIDGNLLFGTAGLGFETNAANDQRIVTISGVTEVLTAASHTIKVQWAVDNGASTGTIFATSAQTFRFSAWEV